MYFTRSGFLKIPYTYSWALPPHLQFMLLIGEGATLMAMVYGNTIMNISRIKHTLLNYCTSIIDTHYFLVSTLYFPFPTNVLMEKQTRSKQTDSV